MQKHQLFMHLFSEVDNNMYRLLDVGCGEGFTLAYFLAKKWQVLGLDYSNFGISSHNPQCLDYFQPGDIYTNMSALEQHGDLFTVVWLDNVLEHVLDPLVLLEQCYRLTQKGGVLVIEVPNDFSTIQLLLKKQQLVDRDFWVAIPDHISYFNKQGLINICKAAQWHHYRTIGDYPIDFSLLNPDTNYITDKSKGLGSHLMRIRVENLLHEISVEKTNNLYEILGDMGLGRQIISVFVK